MHTFLPVWAALAATPSFGPISMEALEPTVHVEATTSEQERAWIREVVRLARAGVDAALGPSKHPEPAMVFCQTDACRVFVAGPHRRSWALGPNESVPGAAFVSGEQPTVLVLTVEHGARGIALHELVHAELALRLPDAFVPQWFHEGLAAELSGAPDCDDRPARGIEDLRTLDSPALWGAHTNGAAQHGTYCQARAEVAAWIHANGRPKLHALLEALERGEPFYPRYGALKTQAGAGPLGKAAERTLLSLSFDDRSVAPETDGVRGRGALLREGAFITSEGLVPLGVVDQPFTVSLWVKPELARHVLVHASAKPTGDGWCTPLLGFDAEGRLAGQVVWGKRPESFLSATGPTLPEGRFSHVAMTWSPSAGVILFVDGEEAARAAPSHGRERHFHTRGSGVPLYLTFGSDQGAACWSPRVARGAFTGALDEVTVANRAFSAREVAALHAGASTR